MHETVFIIGRGAIGKALAVSLTLAGQRVILLHGRDEDGEKTEILLRMRVADGTVYDARVPVAPIHLFSQFDGIVAVATKAYGNESLAVRLKDRIGHSPLVLLQNGLGVEQPFIDQGLSELFRVVLFATSQVDETGMILFKPVAASAVGRVSGHTGALAGVADRLNTDLFPFRAEPAIQPVIWKKVLINCVFNSICPLLHADNGIFHRNEQALSLGRQVIGEGLLIAEAMGVQLSEEAVIDGLLQISKASDGQLISTLQDILNGRQTEMEQLNLAIVQLAETLGEAHRVPLTRLLGEMILLKAGLPGGPSTESTK